MNIERCQISSRKMFIIAHIENFGYTSLNYEKKEKRKKIRKLHKAACPSVSDNSCFVRGNWQCLVAHTSFFLRKEELLACHPSIRTLGRVKKKKKKIARRKIDILKRERK